jgi:hypothetical protein
MVCKVEGASLPSLSLIDFKLSPVPVRLVGAVACAQHIQNIKALRPMGEHETAAATTQIRQR